MSNFFRVINYVNVRYVYILGNLNGKIWHKYTINYLKRSGKENTLHNYKMYHKLDGETHDGK